MDAVLENIARDEENRAYAIWRPTRLSLGATTSMTEDEVRTAELYKKVRSILNKLTPEKFERLLNQIRVLSIDNEERLKGFVDLVFEKAVSMDEPNFSVACALMCKELALMQVPANITKSNKEEQQFVNFRQLLITRCQNEFEQNSVDENAIKLKLKEIDDCMDPEKKNELQVLLEEEDRRMRVKSIGNIRFIGELFKQRMLTVKVMLRCINILLDKRDEDSLECLCILLTTVGKDLELAKNQNLQSYFNTMQEIVDKKHGKISNKVRFMVQNVIDLRNSKWVPRMTRTSEITLESKNLFGNRGRFAPDQEKKRAYYELRESKLRMQNIMEAYLNDYCTLKECESNIKASIDQSNLQEFVIEGYNRVLGRSATARRKTGILFAYLTKNQTLSNDDLCKALKQVLSHASSPLIEYSVLWDYLAEMMLPLVAEGVVSLDRLRFCSDSEVLLFQSHAHELIAPLLKQLVADKGPSFVVELLWQSTVVNFTDFMSADIDSSIKENVFYFVLSCTGTPENQESESWDQVHSRLLQFFKSNTTFDTITDWIYANVGDRVKENQFIRTLVTAIVENAVYNVNSVMKLNSEVLKQHYLLLQRFVDNQGRLELQCLFALQALVHKWEHPPGLLLSIFERFWEDGLLSNDSFMAWEKCTDPAEQEGKGVALKAMQSLFMSLKEAEYESGSSTSDEA